MGRMAGQSTDEERSKNMDKRSEIKDHSKSAASTRAIVLARFPPACQFRSRVMLYTAAPVRLRKGKAT